MDKYKIFSSSCEAIDVFSGLRSGAIDMFGETQCGVVDAFRKTQFGAVDAFRETQSGAVDVFSGPSITSFSDVSAILRLKKG